jgi:hypothetical protein
MSDKTYPMTSFQNGLKRNERRHGQVSLSQETSVVCCVFDFLLLVVMHNDSEKNKKTEQAGWVFIPIP